MDILIRLLTVLLCVLLVSLAGPCLASHDYPRIANYFTGFHDLEYCDMLSRWDAVVLNCNLQDIRPEMLDSLRTLNPDITIISYFPAACIWAGYDSVGRIGCGYGDKVDEADWWLYDTRGNRIGSSDYAWFVNLSTKCPEDENGQTANEWLAGYVADEIISSGMWDGLLLDGLSQTVFWINNWDIFFAELPAEVDADRDGIADPPESLNVWWGTGVSAYLSRLRQEVGDSQILVGNDKNYSNACYLNGGIREDFPKMHGGWEENMFAPYGYLTMCRDYLQEPLNLTTMLCWWEDEEADMYGPRRTGSYERFLHFTLSSALLGDGYYILNGKSSQLWWEDVYDLDLGSPASDAYLDSVWNDMYDCFSPIWKRDFSNGVVYCNPFEQYLTLDDGTWLGPEDGRIKSFSPPLGTTVEIEGDNSQRRFDQGDDAIAYSIRLTNHGDRSTYSYVWANLLDDADTLVAGAHSEYLVGAGATRSENRFLRIRDAVQRGTYCLEVMVGGEDHTIVDRDTILVTRVIDFEKEQKQNMEQGMGLGNLLVCPQPLIGPDATMRLEVKGIDSSSRSLTIRLYDVRGRLVRTVTEDEPEEDAGLEIGLRAEGGGSLVPGVYFVTVETGEKILRKKVVLLHN